MTKTVNYTESQTLELVAAYVAADSDKSRAGVVASYALNFGKTAASIRAKLVREGVYVAKKYKTKTGGKAISKEKLVEGVAALMSVSSEMLVGLEKANKNTIIRLYNALDSAIGKAESLEAEMRGEADD